MKGKSYVVLTEIGHFSANDDGELEIFHSLKRALARAKQLAKDEPGESVGIYVLFAEAKCIVAPPRVDHIR